MSTEALNLGDRVRLTPSGVLYTVTYRSLGEVVGYSITSDAGRVRHDVPRHRLIVAERVTSPQNQLTYGADGRITRDGYVIRASDVCAAAVVEWVDRFPPRDGLGPRNLVSATVCVADERGERWAEVDATGVDDHGRRATVRMHFRRDTLQRLGIELLAMSDELGGEFTPHT